MAFAGTGPVHVVADHAHLDHATDLTTFYGKAREQARLWQGSDSVAAPVLELSRAHATLAAHGLGGDAEAVNAVFTSSTARPGGQGHASCRSGSALRHPSAEPHPLLRGGGAQSCLQRRCRRADLLWAFAIELHGCLLHRGGRAERPWAAVTQPPAKTPDLQSSQVSQIVARGGVQLQQPGRKGTGEELTYTAQDGKFVLTGTSTVPPRLTDQVRGTVTGASLIFNDRDDSVIVSGGPSKAVTQTRVAK